MWIREQIKSPLPVELPSHGIVPAKLVGAIGEAQDILAQAKAEAEALITHARQQSMQIGIEAMHQAERSVQTWRVQQEAAYWASLREQERSWLAIRSPLLARIEQDLFDLAGDMLTQLHVAIPGTSRVQAIVRAMVTYYGQRGDATLFLPAQGMTMLGDVSALPWPCQVDTTLSDDECRLECADGVVRACFSGRVAALKAMLVENAGTGLGHSAEAVCLSVANDGSVADIKNQEHNNE
ncbi:HrpE/YscL family type III secretion apparatus protein [Chitinivorax sp. B]|uniref:HrpE/YscL family type III secretion apparatus protein n=1 Tax=Chitinivorax sp. B TaxID=2502235 RepID=UPI00148550F7|nr:HrpE/YscL family type III secretion apparatus protein [Chitinivorax sp. B]